MTKFRMLAKLIFGASIAVPSFCHAATSRDKSGEFCLVSPSAVDVERSSRTSGSISVLGGVFGGGSVDRDVTDRRTTNLSDDSYKTKREQYAIECKLATDAAKTDDERRVIAQTLFRRWFPELAPKDGPIETAQETPAMALPNNSADAPSLFQTTPTAENAETSSLANDTGNQPIQNRDDEPMKGVSSNVNLPRPLIKSYVMDNPNWSYLELKRQIELTNFSRAKISKFMPTAKAWILGKFNYSCLFDKNTNLVSLINIPLYEFDQFVVDGKTTEYAPTEFFVSVMIFDSNHSITMDKHFRELTLNPKEEIFRFSYQYDVSGINIDEKDFNNLLDCEVNIVRRLP